MQESQIFVSFEKHSNLDFQSENLQSLIEINVVALEISRS